MRLSAFALSLPTLFTTVKAASYSLTDNWVGSTFLTNFTWQAEPDPTHGRVNYLSLADSHSKNLTYASSNRFILKADSTTVLTPSGPGRDSNRIISNKAFGANTVLVADLNHMPTGCGTWPALWSSDVVNWPTNGEIDILEGVNDQGPNAMTLHTLPGCTMPAINAGNGTVKATDCNWEVDGNAGCGVSANSANSYGPAFNAAGGGWYVMERTTEVIQVWFWSRQATNVPAEVKTPGQVKINTANWGRATAIFPNTSCDIASKFGLHNIIINLTFCGDWAGAVYSSNGCPGTCVDHVNNSPEAFANSFFDINAIRMYGA